MFTEGVRGEQTAQQLAQAWAQAQALGGSSAPTRSEAPQPQATEGLDWSQYTGKFLVFPCVYLYLPLSAFVLIVNMAEFGCCELGALVSHG